MVVFFAYNIRSQFPLAEKAAFLSKRGIFRHANLTTYAVHFRAREANIHVFSDFVHVGRNTNESQKYFRHARGLKAGPQLHPSRQFLLKQNLLVKFESCDYLKLFPHANPSLI